MNFGKIALISNYKSDVKQKLFIRIQQIPNLKQISLPEMTLLLTLESNEQSKVQCLEIVFRMKYVGIMKKCDSKQWLSNYGKDKQATF